MKEYGDDESNKVKRFNKEFKELDEKALQKLKDDHLKLVEAYEKDYEEWKKKYKIQDED